MSPYDEYKILRWPEMPKPTEDVYREMKGEIPKEYAQAIMDHLKVTTIVRVLTYEDHIKFAEEDIQPHLREIQKRYSELKEIHMILKAKHIARVEWLERFMKKTHTP